LKSARLNPYTPGAGTPPLTLVGRSEQLALVRNLIDQVEAGRSANPVVYLGLRGVGKTSLLYGVRDELRRRGWLAGYYEVRRNVEPGEAVRSIVESSAGLSTGKLRKALATGAHSIGGLKLAVGPTGASFEIDSKAARHGNTDPYPELVAFLRSLGKAAQQSGVGVALLIDELQIFRKRDIAALIQALSALEGEPIVLIGAGLPYLPEDLSKANTYAERFRYEEIARLGDADARSAVNDPAFSQGVTYDDDALDKILELANGYPYFLQLYASESWIAADGAARITLEHVQTATVPVQRQLDVGLYAARYKRLSEGERAYVDAMVAVFDESLPPLDGSFQVGSGDVARALGRDLTQLSTTRDRIIRKGIIHSPRPRTLEFSVPGFADYVRRQSAANA
jgi:hypothetical protein